MTDGRDISDQNVFFLKWVPAAILDVRNSSSFAFLAISDQNTTFLFCSKWPPAAISDVRNSFSFALLTIWDQNATSSDLVFIRYHAMPYSNLHVNFKKNLSQMSESSKCKCASFSRQNSFLPVILDQAAILDVRNLFLFAFLAISNQNATFIFFLKMAAGGHFECPKLIFGCIFRLFSPFLVAFHYLRCMMNLPMRNSEHEMVPVKPNIG